MDRYEDATDYIYFASINLFITIESTFPSPLIFFEWIQNDVWNLHECNRFVHIIVIVTIFSLSQISLYSQKQD